ncbi:ABC transporter ATP-binding protein [Formosa maritima]|uniref:ATP-binding cassette domain-containing protein n=1 Tax=Formosa maritima TaxID=2592046 RepID=A0A5D0G4W0_9FLAO|nr:ATP-binding cassette domain-containing protein [Formosa maritima]TYA53895.1 ATP-binding cassette domain-containing protein [Formosa maritima]
MIKIENLSKFYGKKQVLNSINLEFKKGKIYGIVGENGAGKTTLFRCISGLENYNGNILSDYTKLKDHLGLLLTEPYFFSKITGKEYIQLLAYARQTKLTNIEDKNIFDLPLKQYASTYSTGMKKKLALTAILLQENNVFILDEPFNGVDIQSNLIITEIIKRFKKLEKTVIISSHIFSTLAETCDEIYLMKNGEIVKKVEQADFNKLENEMKEFTVGNRIDKLELK